MPSLVAKVLGFLKDRATLLLVCLLLCSVSALYGHRWTATYYESQMEALRLSYVAKEAEREKQSARESSAQKDITIESQDRYQARRAALDAALGERMRRDTSGTNGTVYVPVPETSRLPDDSARECVPVKEHRELEGRCARDALKLEELQAWVREQEARSRQ